MLIQHPRAPHILAELRRHLDLARYETCLRAARGERHFAHPFPSDDPGARDVYLRLSRLDPARRDLIRLLAFDEALPRDRANPVLGADLVDDLLELGLLITEGDCVRTDAYRVAALGGIYLIVNYQSPDPDRGAFDVYLGGDSWHLAHSIEPRPGDHVLDLGTGSGALAILAAQRGAERVVGVELVEQACLTARLNALLNGVEDRVEIRQGDLWLPVAGERFDLVISNPPYVAAPAGLELPSYSGGGADGLILIRRILDGFADHARPGGRAALTFWIGGDDTGTALDAEIGKRIGQDGRWSAEMLLHERATMRFGDYVVTHRLFSGSDPSDDSTDEDLRRRAEEELHQAGQPLIYGCLLFLEPPESGARFTVTRLFPPVDRYCRLHLDPDLVDDEGVLHSASGESYPLTTGLRDFLGRLDGETTLADAIAAHWGDLADRYEEAGQDLAETMSHLTQLCSSLLADDTLTLPALRPDRSGC